MTAQPNRRWFRFAFSLRTMFMVMTIFGVSLGWVALQYKITKERNWLISSTNCDCWISQKERLSVVRVWLGDDAYQSVELPVDCGSERIREFEHAFPEAELYIVEKTGDTFRQIGFRDSLSKPRGTRYPNRGEYFKTGLIEK